MLKEYLLEGVSLLVEAVLGSPTKAQAACWYEYDPCTSCGADKKTRYLCCPTSPIGYYCEQWGCVYC